MKRLKKVLIISVILFIQFLFVLYRIIYKFWRKYNRHIKEFVKKLDQELRAELT